MAPYTQVGNYILKRKIGEGAFAEVRLAVHQDTKEEFAVKVFDRDALPKVHFERDIKREIKIMQHLRHPNIVSIHAVLVTDKKLYLVMELVRGGELYDEIVSKRRVDEQTSRRYFQQIVDAMVYCHRCGVVHRDLKPENLLLDGNGNVKITDFGMSWMKENINPALNVKQLLRTQCGTPKYMAPEIIVRPSEGYDGEKLDAWECGMVLYALLAGYLPFSGEDDNTIFKSILNGKLMYPSHFSPGAKDLLSRLLEKDPAKRSSLSEIREHFWFLVNYEGDAVKGAQVVSKQSNSGAQMSEHCRGSKVDDSEKENRDPRQNDGERVVNTATKADSRYKRRVSPAVGEKGKESKGTISQETRLTQAVNGSKAQPSLHPRKSASGALQEYGQMRSANPSDGSPVIVQVHAKLSSMPGHHVARGQRRNLPSPLNPTFLHDLESGDENRDVCVETKHNSEAKNIVATDKSANGQGPELQQIASLSPKIKPPRDSARNGRGKGDTDGAKRTPKKSPALSTKLSSVGKMASSGGETVEDDEAPLSFRDRLRSPLANVFKSLRSGVASGDTETGVDSIKSSWFETSPTSLAELAKRSSNTNQNKQIRMSHDLSSSGDDLGLARGEAPTQVELITTPRIELPMSPSAFKKMTKVFQKRS